MLALGHVRAGRLLALQPIGSAPREARPARRRAGPRALRLGFGCAADARDRPERRRRDRRGRHGLRRLAGQRLRARRRRPALRAARRRPRVRVERDRRVPRRGLQPPARQRVPAGAGRRRRRRAAQPRRRGLRHVPGALERRRQDLRARLPHLLGRLRGGAARPNGSLVLVGGPVVLTPGWSRPTGRARRATGPGWAATSTACSPTPRPRARRSSRPARMRRRPRLPPAGGRRPQPGGVVAADRGAAGRRPEPRRRRRPGWWR